MWRQQTVPWTQTRLRQTAHCCTTSVLTLVVDILLCVHLGWKGPQIALSCLAACMLIESITEPIKSNHVQYAPNQVEDAHLTPCAGRRAAGPTSGGSAAAAGPQHHQHHARGDARHEAAAGERAGRHRAVVPGDSLCSRSLGRPAGVQEALNAQASSNS